MAMMGVKVNKNKVGALKVSPPKDTDEDGGQVYRK